MLRATAKIWTIPDRYFSISLPISNIELKLVYVGVSNSRSDWNEAKTVIENAALVDAAYFCVCDEGENGVLSPVEGDAIVYNGDRYSVSNIVEHDVAGSHFVLLATKAERALGR